MTFYRIDNVPTAQTDVIFRESSLNKALAVLFLSSFAVVLLFLADREAWWFYLAAGFILLLDLLFFGLWRKTLAPTNWLLRYSPAHRRIIVKYRSFANAHLPAEDLVAFSLERDEVRFVRRSTERRTTIDTGAGGGGTQTNRITYLDIGVDRALADEIDRHLAAERGREGPERGPLHVRSKSLDYPVNVTSDGVVRLTWRSGSSWITPPVARALAMLSEFARVLDPEEQNTDYATPTEPAEVDAKARALLQSGDRFAAIALVRHAYGSSLSDAQNYLDGLSSSDTAQTTTAPQT